MAAMVSPADFPANARRPDTASYRTQPSEKISLDGPTFSPRTCSGDM
jgi:hypothetical protein